MDYPGKRKMDFPSVLKSDLLNNFENELNSKLELYYPEALCSNAFVADQFNVRCNYDSFITRETARRWMKGEVLPEYIALFTLRAWLGIDINALLPFDPVLKIEIEIRPPEHLSQEEIQTLILQTIDSINKVQLELKKQKNSLVHIQQSNILS